MQTLLALIDALPALGNRRASGFASEHGARWWTYRELHAMVYRAARILASHDIARGQRILLHGPNSPEWVAFFLGAALRGIVVVPVDANDSTERLLDLARLTNAVFLIDERRNPHVAIPRHDLHDLADVAIDTGCVDVQPDDPAAILFTSGSTGAPRGVVLTHANLMHQVAPFLRLRAPLRLVRFRLLALSPLSHVQGLVVGLLVPYAIGLLVLYTHSVEPLHLIRTIRTSRIRFLNAVPRILDLLERELRTRIGDGGAFAMARAMGRRFRCILVGGATLPASRERFWRRSGIAVVQGYGLTETSALATINLPFVGRTGSIGRAVHRDSLRIADDGELLVRGPHVATNFVGDAVDAFADDGYLRTGDLARRDARNRFFFIGRKKDALVTAEGHTIHPAALESRLLELPFVRDAIVLARTRDGLEELHAVLLLDREGDRDGDAAHSVQQANAASPAHERIRSWSVWPDPDFPRTLLGKADRPAIARRLPTSPVPTNTPRLTNLAACVLEPDPRRRVDGLVEWFAAHPDPQLVETLRLHGVDSIEVLQVLSRLESEKRIVVRESVDDTHAPTWSITPGLGTARWFLRRLFVDPFLALTLKIDVEGREHLAHVDARCFYALAGEDRLDRLDFLRIYRALPPARRRRLMFLLASNTVFAKPRPDLPLWYRTYVHAVFRFLMPLFIPFSLFPKFSQSGNTDALRRACLCIDRGFTPLTSWGRGTAIMATECQLAVVPIRLRATEKNRVTVIFQAPIPANATRTSAELHTLVTTAHASDDNGLS